MASQELPLLLSLARGVFKHQHCSIYGFRAFNTSGQAQTVCKRFPPKGLISAFAEAEAGQLCSMTVAMHVLQAYLTVAPFIAQFPEYKQALADHLLSTKLSHWERSLRELTSKALAALVPTQPGFLQTTAVDTLLPLCLNSILEVRHGAALGVGELTLALHSQGQGPALDTKRQCAVAAIVPAIEKARLYRGKGGELMRGAVCRSAWPQVFPGATYAA